MGLVRVYWDRACRLVWMGDDGVGRGFTDCTCMCTYLCAMVIFVGI